MPQERLAPGPERGSRRGIAHDFVVGSSPPTFDHSPLDWNGHRLLPPFDAPGLPLGALGRGVYETDLYLVQVLPVPVDNFSSGFEVFARACLAQKAAERGDLPEAEWIADAEHAARQVAQAIGRLDRKSTRLNSSHG